MNKKIVYFLARFIDILEISTLVGYVYFISKTSIMKNAILLFLLMAMVMIILVGVERLIKKSAKKHHFQDLIEDVKNLLQKKFSEIGFYCIQSDSVAYNLMQSFPNETKKLFKKNKLEFGDCLLHSNLDDNRFEKNNIVVMIEREAVKFKCFIYTDGIDYKYDFTILITPYSVVVSGTSDLS